jgi:hypothetical protein
MPDRSRLAGVDAARGAAVLGMAAVHVLPRTTDEGDITLAFVVVSGRASAAFAVLAGVGVALATRGGDRVRQRVRLVLRAVLIGALGLWLGDLDDSGVAVILAYYAVFFLLLLPFLGWPPRRLLLAAGTVALLAPVLGHVARQHLTGREDGGNPTFASLEEPGPLAVDLLLAGVYPAVPWAAYLLTGLAVGRLALDRPATAARLAAAGAAAAVLATAASALLLGPFGGLAALGEATGLGERVVGEEIDYGFFGTTPTDSPWWLAVDARHSSTTPDLVATGGTALLLLGACLLLARRAGPLLAPLAAVGSMPLTLYCLHVWLLDRVEEDDPERFYLQQVVAALVVATLWRCYVGRGPLEAALAAVGRLVDGVHLPSRAAGRVGRGT